MSRSYICDSEVEGREMTTQSDLQIINVALTIIVSNKINKCLLYSQSVFSNSHSVVFVVCSVKRKYNVTISTGKEHLVVDDHVTC